MGWLDRRRYGAKRGHTLFVLIFARTNFRALRLREKINIFARIYFRALSELKIFARIYFRAIQKISIFYEIIRFQCLAFSQRFVITCQILPAYDDMKNQKNFMIQTGEMNNFYSLFLNVPPSFLRLFKTN